MSAIPKWSQEIASVVSSSNCDPHTLAALKDGQGVGGALLFSLPRDGRPALHDTLR